MRDSRIEIRIGGTGGQGLILSAKMLADALAAGGKRVAQSQTYEPTSRGGFCNADLVISDAAVDFPLTTALDHLVLLDRLAIKPSWPLLKPGALVIADTRLCPELPEGDYRRYHLPLSRTALELGSERVTRRITCPMRGRRVCCPEHLTEAWRRSHDNFPCSPAGGLKPGALVRRSSRGRLGGLGRLCWSSPVGWAE